MHMIWSPPYTKIHLAPATCPSDNHLSQFRMSQEKKQKITSDMPVPTAWGNSTGQHLIRNLQYKLYKGVGEITPKREKCKQRQSISKALISNQTRGECP